jgi:cyclophilin family peptidyl-prolyl cis-trans isomerase
MSLRREQRSASKSFYALRVHCMSSIFGIYPSSFSTLKMPSFHFAAFVLSLLYFSSIAWSPSRVKRRSTRKSEIRNDGTMTLPMKHRALKESSMEINVRRRHLLTIPVAVLITTENDRVLAVVQQAVGSGESNCRVKNNCLEVGEWDGAIGWGWGGKDRCDPTDPRCGTDGRLRETPIVGKPVPALPLLDADIPLQFTHVAALQIEIGRNEVGVLKMGFYGNEAPRAVQQIVDFLSQSGFTAIGQSSSSLGRTQPAVSLRRGGIVTSIVPNTAIEFGVPLQSVAYAKSMGRSKVDEAFVPQPRPPKDASPLFTKRTRPHDSAGLISIPEKGLGYGGTGFESDDECYESSFLITAQAVPDLDRQNRVVIGQILDAESMAFLERLANVPTKRGIRGVIPGQTSGPPLPKVVVQQIQVSNVSPR